MPQNYNLTGSLLGTEVSSNGPVIMWKDKHITILLAIYDDEKNNLYEAVDILIIQYLAKCPEFSPNSSHVIHFTNYEITTNVMEEVVSSAKLRMW